MWGLVKKKNKKTYKNCATLSRLKRKFLLNFSLSKFNRTRLSRHKTYFWSNSSLFFTHSLFFIFWPISHVFLKGKVWFWLVPHNLNVSYPFYFCKTVPGIFIYYFKNSNTDLNFQLFNFCKARICNEAEITLG